MKAIKQDIQIRLSKSESTLVFSEKVFTKGIERSSKLGFLSIEEGTVPTEVLAEAKSLKWAWSTDPAVDNITKVEWVD